MKRDFATFYPENAEDGYVPGDHAAHRAAAALADRLDAPTIAALADMLTLLERVGGQFYVTAVRIKSDLDPDWHISGLTFDYESRDAKVQRMSPPEEVLGIPVTDSQTPPVEIEMTPDKVDPPSEEIDEEPEPESNLEPVALTE